MQTAVKTKKPRKQAVSGRFWAMRTYRGRIKDDHKIDPACGSGGMFVQTGDFVNNAGLSANTAMTFYGQENNPTTYNLARMNMLMHGVDYQNFDIYKGDSVGSTKRRDNRHDESAVFAGYKSGSQQI